ncbi:hypothetical protein [Lacinutrix mariniflava]|uniref:hypothetical protein n=1 Tax=Lacinutrix mariniflava TaxID=342955 RepID=UPI0006E3E245|nr:hypothetical protein [Lacinutrix mariniflava]
MKKIFTFCFFAFALLIGTQSASAQDQVSLKEKAYLQAKEMRTQIKFDDTTLEQVYEAYYAHEKNLLSIEDSKSTGEKEIIAKANTTLEANLKSALGEDLYKRYLILTEKKDSAE